MTVQTPVGLAPAELVAQLGAQGRAAQRHLTRLSDAEKASALRAASASIRAAQPAILAANAQDIAAGEANGLAPAMLDRLRLDAGRLGRDRRCGGSGRLAARSGRRSDR
jgi:glutamate-5-semialdehyde dehydrogenase